VTDLLCAPWLLAPTEDGDTPESLRVRRLEEIEKYAEEYIASRH
jgi:hypothetical protein